MDNDIAQLYSAQSFDEWTRFLREEILRHYRQHLTSETPFPQPDRKTLAYEARELLERRDRGPQSAHRALKEMTELFFRSLTQLHSPQTFGHQVSAPVPISASMEWLSSIFNPGLGIFELGNFSIAAEKALIGLLGKKIGWGEFDFDGIVTGGGSLANMTALLSARQKVAPDFWESGVTSKLGIIVSGDAHYSVTRSAGILGTGTRFIYKASADLERRMRLEDVEAAYARAIADGARIFAVVGSACSTSTGAFDHLDEIGRWCRERGIWFHVDAAHGGGILFSRTFAPLLAGIAWADSITWDAHKMMGVPSLSTVVLFREKAASFATFKQDAPYLFPTAEAEVMEFDPALRTLECTRRAMGLAPYALIAAFGEAAIEAIVDRTIGAVREFYDVLRASGDFVPLHFPQCNILCFQYLPVAWRGRSGEEISNLQRGIRRQVLAKGRYFITGTVLDGQYGLRVTVMNPLTEVSHLRGLLDEVRALAI